MSIKTRFQLLTAALIVISSLCAWLLFQQVAKNIIEEWGLRAADIQVRYDSTRLLKPIEREIALARQMADSRVIQNWAKNEHDPALAAEAIREMESYRRNFSAENYFVALKQSGSYYYNNAEDEFSGKQLRYTLDSDKPDDAWFYQLLKLNKSFHINVNPDTQLGITQLWIDVQMKDGDNTLGIVGTGLPLEAFLEEIVDIEQPGITTVFVDHTGAIQLHRDPGIIDYASLVKPEGQKNTIELLFDQPRDQQALWNTMTTLREVGGNTSEVKSQFVVIDGKRYLAGVVYLPSLDWFELTLLDLEEVIPVSSFAAMMLLFTLILLIAILLVHLALRKLVLTPVAALDNAMLKVKSGDLRPADLPSGSGEIGRLINHFSDMAEAIRNHTEELETRVKDRTQALNELTKLDPLTGLLNRRGMNLQLTQEIDRSHRQQNTFGIIWLDLDHFKTINDSFGHAVGDRALVNVAGLLKAGIRPYDHAARWGGDEFLVLLSPCDETTLQQIGERLRLSIEQTGLPEGRKITVSVGSCLAQPGDQLERLLKSADDALYEAKASGRNRMIKAG